MGAAAQIFIILIAIMAPVIILLFISEYMRNKRLTSEQLHELKMEMQNNSNSDQDKEIAELRERIVVLESIVTDRSYNLERKISNL
ncbi:MAG: hypothetical protein IIC60_14100 [Proteobacteria bacterium]|nr:hypothetical protein [Pseudomonadota bacterium]